MTTATLKERYLLSVIGDEDTVTGFLMAGIGQSDKYQNFFVVNNKTSVQQIQSTFTDYCQRKDVAILLINQHIADEIRDTIEEMQEAQAFPVILEIPSKEHPYNPDKDSVIRKIRKMFGNE